jgi:tagatose-6-phosphate ketose/aldose isomerase
VEQALSSHIITELIQQAQHNGSHDTLHEILQQPATWRDTATRVEQALPQLQSLVSGVQSIILTGSGSSEYAAECARTAFQQIASLTAQSIGSGALLTDSTTLLSRARPALMIHFARSGDSPESVGALQATLHTDPQMRQLAITCNADGKLAHAAATTGKLQALTLDARTNDRSLVMTSSFTNMVLAAIGLAFHADIKTYTTSVNQIADAAETLLPSAFEALQVTQQYKRVFYLADLATFGAAREAALKMTEMTAGRVITVAETYLGLRHGPMSAVHDDTLIVCFLSSDPLIRAYEEDLIRELNAKELGIGKVFVGASIPRDLVRENDIVLEHPVFAETRAAFHTLLHVAVGQVLAFYRCLQEGLKPDAPSATGIINRVVQKFQLHGAAVEQA